MPRLPCWTSARPEPNRRSSFGEAAMGATFRPAIWFTLPTIPCAQCASTLIVWKRAGRPSLCFRRWRRSAETEVPAIFDVADDGTLVYLPQNGSAPERERSLTWVDRRGKEELISATPRAYLYPRLSPDGSRVAMDVREQDSDIWVWDFAHQNAIRVTKDPAFDRTPVWSADGQWIFFSSNRAGQPAIFRQRADGTGAAESLTQSSVPQYALSLSPDGALLLIHEGVGGSLGGDLMALQLQVPAHGVAPKPSVRTLVKTAAGEDNGVISPDGQWLAYQSNESGSWDIYVRPMRDLEHGARAIVSTGGGTQPHWSRDGQELFYVSLRNEMMSVPVRRGDAWSSGTPVKLFDASPYFIGGDGNPFF